MSEDIKTATPKELPEEMRGEFSWAFVEKTTCEAIASYLRFVAAGSPTEVRQVLKEQADNIQAGRFKRGGKGV